MRAISGQTLNKDMMLSSKYMNYLLTVLPLLALWWLNLQGEGLDLFFTEMNSIGSQHPPLISNQSDTGKDTSTCFLMHDKILKKQQSQIF